MSAFRWLGFVLSAFVLGHGPGHAEGSGDGHDDVQARAAGASMDVVVIVADDLGWSDVFPAVPTPNLARLARAGTTFRGAYAMPICTPSRYAMLFGRYGRREGVLAGARTLAPGPAPVPSLATRSLAELFRSAGYATAAFGKWHLDPPTAPLEGLARAHGFQTFRAGTRGNLGREEDAYVRWTRIDDGVESECTQYATLAVRDAFLGWWRATRGPRFAWLAFHAPHAPLHAPPAELLDGPVPTHSRARYEAAVRALDHVLGDLLGELDLAHTLVVFVSDNGTPPNAPAPGQDARRGKTTVFEPGVHVPLIVAGPGVRAGGESAALVHVVDLFATLAEHAHLALPAGAAEDSLSFAPLLDAPGAPGKRTQVFVEIAGGEAEDVARDEQALRNATHKLRVSQAADGRHEELYDLVHDPEERHPLDLRLVENRAVRDELARALAALPPRRER